MLFSSYFSNEKNVAITTSITYVCMYVYYMHCAIQQFSIHCSSCVLKGNIWERCAQSLKKLSANGVWMDTLQNCTTCLTDVRNVGLANKVRWKNTDKLMHYKKAEAEWRGWGENKRWHARLWFQQYMLRIVHRPQTQSVRAGRVSCVPIKTAQSARRANALRGSKWSGQVGEYLSEVEVTCFCLWKTYRHTFCSMLSKIKIMLFQYLDSIFSVFIHS